MSYPKQVLLREEGPREGFQMLKHSIPTVDKLRLIKALAKTGIQTMEVTSFVRPDRVPQHADAVEVAKKLPKDSGVRYRALYLNHKGFLRATECKTLELEGLLTFAPSEKFLKANMNSSIEKVLKGIPGWLNLFNSHNIKLERIMCSTAFGYPGEGNTSATEIVTLIKKVLTRLDDLSEALPQEITLADTTGYANPELIRRFVCELRNAFPHIAIGLHLHDTRGTGMANVYAGLLEGVDRFDCSVAGMGGCPFTKAAAGNVATEDVAFLCHELGIETGLDLKQYIKCAKLCEEICNASFPGKLKQSGLIT